MGLKVRVAVFFSSNFDTRTYKILKKPMYIIHVYKPKQRMPFSTLR